MSSVDPQELRETVDAMKQSTISNRTLILVGTLVVCLFIAGFSGVRPVLEVTDMKLRAIESRLKVLEDGDAKAEERLRRLQELQDEINLKDVGIQEDIVEIIEAHDAQIEKLLERARKR